MVTPNSPPPTQADSLELQAVPPDVDTLETAGVVQRVQAIIAARMAARDTTLDALAADPRINTLIETGQVTIASELAKMDATGTSEPPKPQGATHKARPTGNVRDRELSYSDLDPYWNAPARSLSPEEATSARERTIAEVGARREQNYIHQFGPDILRGTEAQKHEAIASLFTRGYAHAVDSQSGELRLIKIDVQGSSTVE